MLQMQLDWIPRPQDKFDEPVDNSNAPFCPRPWWVKQGVGKPPPPAMAQSPPPAASARAVAPPTSSARSPFSPGTSARGGAGARAERVGSALDLHASRLGAVKGPAGKTPSHIYQHPVQDQLQNLTYQDWQLECQTPQPPTPFEDASCSLSDTLGELRFIAKKLSASSEIAVDLEHHSHRTFQGITCLMQVSTRTEDFIIDTIALRSHIGPVLGPVFLNPKIVKVMHGSDHDIVWLQRDFGIYIMNLFDTGQAARVLQFPSAALKYLLQHFCDLDVDKRYQLADWRIRPIPAEMMKYAQSDTHFLLYIYDRLKELLMTQSINPPPREGAPAVEGIPPKGGDKPTADLILEVLTRSRNLCLMQYSKELFTETSYLKFYKKFKCKLKPDSLALLAGLYAWRDRVARKEDESVGYVLPNHMLLRLAQRAPTDVRSLVGLLHGGCSVVAKYAAEVIEVMRKSKEQAGDCIAVEKLLDEDDDNEIDGTEKFEAADEDEDHEFDVPDWGLESYNNGEESEEEGGEDSAEEDTGGLPSAVRRSGGEETAAERSLRAIMLHDQGEEAETPIKGGTAQSVSQPADQEVGSCAMEKPKQASSMEVTVAGAGAGNGYTCSGQAPSMIVNATEEVRCYAQESGIQVELVKQQEGNVNETERRITSTTYEVDRHIEPSITGPSGEILPMDISEEQTVRESCKAAGGEAGQCVALSSHQKAQRLALPTTDSRESEICAANPDGAGMRVPHPSTDLDWERKRTSGRAQNASPSVKTEVVRQVKAVSAKVMAVKKGGLLGSMLGMSSKSTMKTGQSQTRKDVAVHAEIGEERQLTKGHADHIVKGSEKLNVESVAAVSPRPDAMMPCVAAEGPEIMTDIQLHASENRTIEESRSETSSQLRRKEKAVPVADAGGAPSEQELQVSFSGINGGHENTGSHQDYEELKSEPALPQAMINAGHTSQEKPVVEPCLSGGPLSCHQSEAACRDNPSEKLKGGAEAVDLLPAVALGGGIELTSLTTKDRVSLKTDVDGARCAVVAQSEHRESTYAREDVASSIKREAEAEERRGEGTGGDGITKAVMTSSGPKESVHSLEGQALPAQPQLKERRGTGTKVAVTKKGGLLASMLGQKSVKRTVQVQKIGGVSLDQQVKTDATEAGSQSDQQAVAIVAQPTPVPSTSGVPHVAASASRLSDQLAQSEDRAELFAKEEEGSGGRLGETDRSDGHIRAGQAEEDSVAEEEDVLLFETVDERQEQDGRKQRKGGRGGGGGGGGGESTDVDAFETLKHNVGPDGLPLPIAQVFTKQKRKKEMQRSGQMNQEESESKWCNRSKKSRCEGGEDCVAADGPVKSPEDVGARPSKGRLDATERDSPVAAKQKLTPFNFESAKMGMNLSLLQRKERKNEADAGGDRDGEEESQERSTTDAKASAAAGKWFFDPNRAAKVEYGIKGGKRSQVFQRSGNRSATFRD